MLRRFATSFKVRVAAAGAAWVVFVALVSSAGCDSDSAYNARLASEIMGIRDFSVPEKGELQLWSGVERKAINVTASWVVSTSLTWKEYKEVARRRLPSTYNLTRSNESEVLFHRNLVGDTHAVHLQLQDVGPPLRVAATFTAMPD